jgi:hypothetical protein
MLENAKMPATKKCPICDGNMIHKTHPKSSVGALGEHAVPPVLPARKGWECDRCRHWIDEGQ